jgi:hypothetical protein
VDGIGDGEPAGEASGTGGPGAGAAPGGCGIGAGPGAPICDLAGEASGTGRPDAGAAPGIGAGPGAPICDPTCGMDPDPTGEPTCGAGLAAALGACGVEAGPCVILIGGVGPPELGTGTSMRWSALLATAIWEIAIVGAASADFAPGRAPTVNLSPDWPSTVTGCGVPLPCVSARAQVDARANAMPRTIAAKGVDGREFAAMCGAKRFEDVIRDFPCQTPVVANVGRQPAGRGNNLSRPLPALRRVVGSQSVL